MLEVITIFYISFVLASFSGADADDNYDKNEASIATSSIGLSASIVGKSVSRQTDRKVVDLISGEETFPSKPPIAVYASADGNKVRQSYCIDS